ncbi:MAG: 3-deoxy-manno-octulosonate cytidylyltransferase [Paramuribaculum sp.]|nr:3-deoxy-manno-octulosonate cytidylyltransferase [Paramuribaculum sp.]MDE6324280.1 3-deoxy-manno-octulosonate cytidylyltransferase [Paramuribaculum sp.]MDE6489450.1 3-deoxy-manno-octulosonate cytidylyltransferase [Paramuribaculum sp.]
MNNVLAIIPARFQSSRLPGKPLADIGGQPMVWHVYRRAAEAIGNDNVIVVTDSPEIVKAVQTRGGNALLSDKAADCGTTRCAHALSRIPHNADIILNLQADEPFLEVSDIRNLAASLDSPEFQIATLARKFDPDDGFESLFSPDNPKVVFDNRMGAMYFSRSIIPYIRDVHWKEWINTSPFYIHAGTYAFRRQTLLSIPSLPHSHAEMAEKLEQLRWLAAGFRIKIVLTESKLLGVDTADELEQARKRYAETFR